MNDGTVLRGHSLGAVPANWHIAGTGDFNGDGKSDILWRNDAGTVAIWNMNDGTVLSGNSPGSMPADWHIANTGDYNGDGKSDILWRNDAGATAIWDIDDGAILHANSLARCRPTGTSSPRALLAFPDRSQRQAWARAGVAYVTYRCGVPRWRSNSVAVALTGVSRGTDENRRLNEAAAALSAAPAIFHPS